jgi:hypothetical protein
MSPQFVDYDGDGDLDLVAGIFDGSPHVALRGKDGWQQPVGILDKDGQRIVMNAYWNFDTKQWDSTERCDPAAGKVGEGHLTSAWAVDWDGDGDLDLLLGDHRAGQVMVRKNEGTREAPAYATRNEAVYAAGAPLVVPGTVTTLRTIDWDGDGVMDLLVGSMGDAYQGKAIGGVYVHRNEGTNAAPKLAAGLQLVAAPAPGESAVGPNAGLYMDCADLDGDGDLDLLVGGYSMWTPKAPELTPEQTARRAVVRAELEALQARMTALIDALMKRLEAASDDAAKDKVRDEVMAEQKAERQEIFAARAPLQKELDALSPGMKRESLTWFYRNLAKD